MPDVARAPAREGTGESCTNCIRFTASALRLVHYDWNLRDLARKLFARSAFDESGPTNLDRLRRDYSQLQRITGRAFDLEVIGLAGMELEHSAPGECLRRRQLRAILRHCPPRLNGVA